LALVQAASVSVEGVNTDSCVSYACGVIKHCLGSDSRVSFPRCVAKQCAFSDGRVSAIPDIGGKERLVTNSRVVEAGCVVCKRTKTDGRVGGASGEVEQRGISLSRVLAG
jgi:hypothetical protein